MIRLITNQGWGDCIASRPAVAAAARKHGEVAVATAYPHIFDGIPGIVCVRPPITSIDCARRNAEAHAWPKHEPRFMSDVQLGYVLQPGCRSIPEQLCDSAGVAASEVQWENLFSGDGEGWDEEEGGLPPRFEPLSFGVYRTPTLRRREYLNESRNCTPGLIAAAVESAGGEWLELDEVGGGDCWDEDERNPDVRVAFIRHGELSIPLVEELVAHARRVITPVSWLAWCGLYWQVPTLCIWGGYCPPQTIFGPLLDLAPHFKVVAPEKVCACFDPRHACEKSIPVERVREAAKEMIR